LADINKSTVSSYSERGSNEYEDPMNKNFLYGKITAQFLEQIKFSPSCKHVLDIGCGTGFGFDVVGQKMAKNNMTGHGVDPATGMLNIAREKFKEKNHFSFDEGSFESIPTQDASVDKIISTLALHWVKSLDAAASELKRVLKSDGSLDIFMIAKDDGAIFKKAIVEAQKKHLSFKQIMKTATLVQRATEEDIKASFSVFGDGFELRVQKFNDVVYGSFNEHMKWWKARSTPVIAEVEDKDQFVLDLQAELEKISTDKGIPFDTAYFWISLVGK
jgi:ubiquinone/menaquinone biosynthesis C-methylase UbiE